MFLQSTIYGRCGSQPPAFHKGTETLCDRCKKSKNMDGCGDLTPVVQFDPPPVVTVRLSGDDVDMEPGDPLDHIIAQHIEKHEASKRIVREWRFGHRLYIERWPWDWTFGFGYIVDGADKLLYLGIGGIQVKFYLDDGML